jgi:hypothetical protein
VLIRLANADDAAKLWRLVEEYVEEQIDLGNPDQR